jgi:hypothetical protein
LHSDDRRKLEDYEWALKYIQDQSPQPLEAIEKKIRDFKKRSMAEKKRR